MSLPVRAGHVTSGRSTAWIHRKYCFVPPHIPLLCSAIFSLCVCLVDRCLTICTFSFGHFLVCPSIYGFGLLLWYLQSLLNLSAYYVYKRDDLSFPVVNFPFIDGDVPLGPSYDGYIS